MLADGRAVACLDGGSEGKARDGGVFVAEDSSTLADQSARMLTFLLEMSYFRRSRVLDYDPDRERIVWFAKLPDDNGPRAGKIRSSFLRTIHSPLSGTRLDFDEEEQTLPWLEVEKVGLPKPPDVRPDLKPWLPQEFLDHPEGYIEKTPEAIEELLLPEVRRPTADGGGSQIERLDADPSRRQRWRQFLRTQWFPWAAQVRALQPLVEVYKTLTYMRNRLLEGEELYELLMATGLLIWRNNAGEKIFRHVLVAPATIEADLSTGALRVVPADPVPKFRLELDMLEPSERPQLDRNRLDTTLEQLGVEAWDPGRVRQVLNLLEAGSGSVQATVLLSATAEGAHADRTMRFYWAPALVLRARRQTGYEQVVRRLLDDVKAGLSSQLPVPWRKLMEEHVDEGQGEVSGADRPATAEDGRLYFPLKSNDEQRQIARRWQHSAAVVVKGPPGTGKSQTIANLICHLLATGQRVLITAHAGKALEVLSNLLPEEVRELCFGTSGMGPEDDHRIAESVERMQQRRHEWDPIRSKQRIQQLEQELQQLETQQQSLQARLLEARRSESEPVTVNEDYTGPLAAIARQVALAREEFLWFPPLQKGSQRSCPLTEDELAELSQLHSILQPEAIIEDEREFGSFDLPGPEHFDALVTEWQQASVRLQQCQQTCQELLAQLLCASQGSPWRLLQSQLAEIGSEQLAALVRWLHQLDELVLETRRGLAAEPEAAKRLCEQILRDLAFGSVDAWRTRAASLEEKQRELKEAVRRLGNTLVHIPAEPAEEILHADACRLRDYLRNKGWRGIGPLAPRIIRETRYLQRWCRVNGHPPRSAEALDLLVAFLEIRRALRSLGRIWPELRLDPETPPAPVVERMARVRDGLQRLLDLFGSAHDLMMLLNWPESSLPGDLADDDRRRRWRQLFRAEENRRAATTQLGAIEQQLDALGKQIACTVDSAGDRVHGCLLELSRAVMTHDPQAYRRAWKEREILRERRPRIRRWRELLARLERGHPELAERLRKQVGCGDWRARLQAFRRAWNWADAQNWLEDHMRFDYNELSAQMGGLQQNIEKRLAELAVERAWAEFLRRADEKFWQTLTAYAQAVRRIGKGTGKYANRHRWQARRYLGECLPTLPAWILPLHRVWDTAPAGSGVFDTIIIDEASQAGTEALLLFYLGKKIIVVGDDMQNSPEAVGIAEEDIGKLIRQHLADFRFREEFRPDMSLYDHAVRIFGSVISLREHFRCVPEIIRFSNDLCYAGRLIPLRQPPPQRLEPLVDVFVRGGWCTGTQERVVNEAEARAVVRCIEEVLGDPRCANKTLGVIVLQGRRQAERIEELLRERIPPQEIERRRLRCGPPPSFQGDERDIIFLSLVMSPDRDFRALTQTDDRRRFNVAMSRARDQVWLIHSLTAADTGGRPDDVRWRLLKFFEGPSPDSSVQCEELQRLERALAQAGHRRRPGTQPSPYESWFEVDVAAELLRRGYRVRSQVPAGQYRIDLVIEGGDRCLAVECDGEAWHGLERFEEDLRRQRQLERAGWRFCRIRESEWYFSREAALTRVFQRCNELGIKPLVGTAPRPGCVRRIVYEAAQLLEEAGFGTPGPLQGSSEESSPAAPAGRRSPPLLAGPVD
jgi:very-short-patch-repair endonuclease